MYLVDLALSEDVAAIHVLELQVARHLWGESVGT